MTSNYNQDLLFAELSKAWGLESTRTLPVRNMPPVQIIQNKSANAYAYNNS